MSSRDDRHVLRGIRCTPRCERRRRWDAPGRRLIMGPSYLADSIVSPGLREVHRAEATRPPCRTDFSWWQLGGRRVAIPLEMNAMARSILARLTSDGPGACGYRPQGDCLVPAYLSYQQGVGVCG